MLAIISLFRFMKNKTSAIILSVFLVATFVRLYNLSGHGLISDELTWMVRSKELIYSLRAKNFSYFDNGWWSIKGDVQAISLPNTFLSGLFYYFTVKGQSHFSLGWFSEVTSVRIPGAMIGAIFIPLFYLIIKKHIGEKTALLASAFLGLDPVSIGLSRWLNQDSTLMVTSFLGLMLYVTVPGYIGLFGSAFFTALAFLTKPQGLLIPGVLFLLNFIRFKSSDTRKRYDYIKWLAMLVLFTILMFPYLWKNPVNRLWSYLQNQYSVSSNQGREVYFQGRPTINPPWYYYLVTVPFHVQEPILIGLFITMVLVLTHKREKGLNLPFWAVAAGLYVLVYFFIVSFSSIKLGTRYIFPIWPYLIIAGTVGLVWLEKRIPRRFKTIYWPLLFLFPVTAIIRFSPYYYLFYNTFTTPQAYQNRETIGFCDGIKPSIDYLGNRLYHGVTMDIQYCHPVAQYFTSFTIRRAPWPQNKPDFVIVENSGSQTSPGIELGLIEAGYKMEKQITFNGLALTRIYSFPSR